ncbi:MULTISPECIES: NAD(P)/FAD-dependent oxidoreductase [Kitasatospora]|uniref:FAD-binding oxidoreductase n=1 Tax=Kitasatospora cystarginea TaxID=58350 RepID=A0ABP5RRE4_9ACTN
MSTLPEHTQALVIGAGVIGTSVAFHLAEAGVSTVVLEQATPGSGASGATAGVLRTYFPGDAANGRLAVRSMAAYHDFAERTGADVGLRRVGFLVLFTEEHQVRNFRADQAAQHAAGVDVELVTAADAVRLNPLLGERDILAAAWAPEAYVCDPQAIVRGYAAAAQRAGAVLRTATSVTGIDPDGRVRTPHGSITAGSIVCAAGPWSQPVAAMAGVDLPVTGHPTELLLTDELPDRPEIPLTLHAASGLRVRGWEDRILVGMGRPRPDEPRESWLQRLSGRLGATYPPLAGIGLRPGWTGAWDGSPDGTALIGRAPSRPFLYAAGFSGHGLCQAPVAGEIIRDLHSGAPLPSTAADLSLDRLTAAAPSRQP